MKLLSISLLLAFHIAIIAQDGILNSNFGSNGIVTAGVGTLPQEATALAIQSDGKIVVAGYCDNATDADFAIARYNSNGLIDEDFDGDSGSGNGIVTIDFTGNDEGINGVTIQPDGKIVVVGSTYNGSIYVIAVARLLSDGKLDTGFGIGGLVTTEVENSDNEANSVIIQTDGKIVVAGYAATETIAKIAVVRYNSNGTLDTSFGSDGKVTTEVGSIGALANSVDIQSDSKIVVAGYMETESESYDFVVVRYNINGSLDTSFDTDGIVTTETGSFADMAYSINIDANQKIVVSGITSTVDNLCFAVLRYNSDGTLDTTFDTDGIATVDFGDDVWVSCVSAIQADNKILIAGSIAVNGYLDFAVARLNSNGSLDTPFGTNGKVITDISTSNDDDDYLNGVALQSNGEIVVAGSSDDRSQFAIVCYSGSSGPLPVELTHFTANVSEEGVILNWQTAIEVNNYGFEIQRSDFSSQISDKEWEVLSLIQGHGNSNSPKYYEFEDENPLADSAEYRLKQIDTDGKFTYYHETVRVNGFGITDVEDMIPTEFTLNQNYPNPFNPSTTISYGLKSASDVQLTVYNVLGQKVTTLVNQKQQAGKYQVQFDASNLASGTYIYKISAGEFVSVKKLLLMK